jgi:hypothetical protein
MTIAAQPLVAFFATRDARDGNTLSIQQDAKAEGA